MRNWTTKFATISQICDQCHGQRHLWINKWHHLPNQAVHGYRPWGLTTFQHASFLAIAEVYKTEGNEAYLKEYYSNAVYFYTEGIKVITVKCFPVWLACMVRQMLVSFHWSYLLWVCFAAFAVSDFLFVCIFNVLRKLHLLTGRCQKLDGHSTIIN